MHLSHLFLAASGAESKLKVCGGRGHEAQEKNLPPPHFSAVSPAFEGALCTRGWAQSCADIGLFVCAMITTTTGIAQQLGIFLLLFPSVLGLVLK